MDVMRKAFALFMGYLALGGVACAATSFHPASSDAEKAVDSVLNRVEQDTEVVLFALKLPERDKKKDKTYQGLFTPALAKSFAATEAAEVKKNCGGHYSADDICGVDLNPITCLQESTESGRLYHTISDADGTALISYRRPDDKEVYATYRLIRQNDGWHLDGVACEGSFRFNMPESPH